MRPQTAVWNQLVAEYPRFSTAVFPQSHSQPVSVAQLCTETFVRKVIAASADLFPMDADKHQAQVWWYSLNNTLLGPALAAMVEFYVTPSLDFDSGHLFVRDPDQGFWLTFYTDLFHPHDEGDETAAWRQAGMDFARCLAPVLRALAAVAGASEPALWAVSADAVAGNAVSAGNDALDPYRGVRVAHCVLAGMRHAVPEARIPQPSFRDYIPDVGLSDTDLAAAMAGQEREVHTVAQRVSCCMIYRCPQAGMCLSCPKQLPAERDRLLIDSFRFSF